MSIPTPYIGHLTEDDYEHVYEPAEDSFILLDALEQDAEELKSLRATLCLEIGSGSGIVSTFLARILGDSALYICTDINPHANNATRRTAGHNDVSLEILLSNLVDPLERRAESRIDILLFNPPYVPTSAEEMAGSQVERDVAGAWAGGSTGMQVTNVVLDMIPRLLSPVGRFYLVAVEQNDPASIVRQMKAVGLDAEVSPALFLAHLD
ncbi:S-adenosyl-L-methionine-dependent methyltransferase [Kockovaella imperatae]|uniref:S-adenosyl-L-methionine-dependent methyltransferase n=1 Tax=Kockovaella imperatae TaxID=4999 RepID=A0A1Y1UA79_9TREE|nr:S-adenosyl-L-methionine-dependent methyltransferase [Kockovaella imperatae]ORX34951.1 S-adenosyl-L-methionine-dependent methyltransferase [Kockovaella imperatae]